MRVFCWTLFLFFLLPGASLTGRLRAAAGRQKPGIVWDRSTLTLISRASHYGRIIRLRTKELLCVHERAGKTWVRRSADNGRTWGDAVLVASSSVGTAANPELLQLADGSVFVFYNERPRRGRKPFAILCCVSTDDGKTWSPPRRIYAADTRRENGCWEPAAVQLPSGEVLLFFANESPYRTSDEQEITLLRSSDNGSTWSAPQAVSFRPGKRDGMPVPLVLRNGRGIVLAIEDNGLSGNFKPSIIHSPLTENWRQGPAGPKSSRRWGALEEPLPAPVYAGAPYICQMPSGETILSVQSTEGGRRKPHMVVYIGDDEAKGFAYPSVPVRVPPSTSCLWNALFVKDARTVTALTRTTLRGVSGLWAIDGRFVPPK